MENADLAHRIIEQLRDRASACGPNGRPTITPAAVQCLIAHWRTAERAGVRFHSEGVYIEGVQFRLGTDVTHDVRSALRWRRAETALASRAHLDGKAIH